MLFFITDFFFFYYRGFNEYNVVLFIWLLQTDNPNKVLGSRTYSTQAPSDTANSSYASGTCNINVALPQTEGSYTYRVEILPGRVARTVGPVTVGKIALKV